MSRTKKDLKSNKNREVSRKMKPFALEGKRQSLEFIEMADYSMEQGLKDGYNSNQVKKVRKEIRMGRDAEKKISRRALKRDLNNLIKELL